MSTARNLIPGLLDELLVYNIFPRLPWSTRPICRAISTSWKSFIDSAQCNDRLNGMTRKFQLPLLQDSLLVCLRDEHNSRLLNMVLVYDKSQVLLGSLPPIDGLPSGRAMMVAWKGIVFLWTLATGKSWSPSRDLIFKLDIGRGKWTWECIQVERTSNWFDAVEFGGKIYSYWEYRRPAYGIRPPVKLDVLVYDMETNGCSKIGKWQISHVGAVSEEDLYGLLSHWPDESMEVMRYDAATNQWKRKEVIPKMSGTLKVVSGDCFDPVMSAATNIIAIGYVDGDAFQWYSSAVQETWVTIENRPGRRTRTFHVVRGILYATCASDSNSKGCQILKGKIHVASRSVEWEMIADVPKPIHAFAKMS